MPAPALISGIKHPISGMPDTNEKYHSINQNQIMHPTEHVPDVRVYFKDRKKLNCSFLRSFFVVPGIGCQFFWLYRKVKRGMLNVRKKNNGKL